MNHGKRHRIAESFTKAADTYEEFAWVQKQTAKKLTTLLLTDRDISLILEAGCGTGFYTGLLNSMYPNARIIALDIAPGMVQTASERFRTCKSIEFINADAEHLPLRPGRNFDLVTSNGVFQWFGQLERSLTCLKNLLGPGGIFAISLFGNRTLTELATAIRYGINEEVNIVAASFPDIGKIQEVTSRLFSNVEIEERSVVRTYPDLPAMLRALKMTGVVPAGTKPVIRTRGQIKSIEREYMASYGAITASYHAIFIRAHA